MGRGRRRRAVEAVRGVDRARPPRRRGTATPGPRSPGRGRRSRRPAARSPAGLEPDTTSPPAGAGRAVTPLPSAATAAQSGTSAGPVGGQLVEQPPGRRRHRLPALVAGRVVEPRHQPDGEVARVDDPLAPPPTARPASTCREPTATVSRRARRRRARRPSATSVGSPKRSPASARAPAATRSASAAGVAVDDARRRPTATPAGGRRAAGGRRSTPTRPEPASSPTPTATSIPYAWPSLTVSPPWSVRTTRPSAAT